LLLGSATATILPTTFLHWFSAEVAGCKTAKANATTNIPVMRFMSFSFRSEARASDWRELNPIVALK
jgi:hypothetical protein